MNRVSCHRGDRSVHPPGCARCFSPGPTAYLDGASDGIPRAALAGTHRRRPPAPAIAAPHDGADCGGTCRVARRTGDDARWWRGGRRTTAARGGRRQGGALAALGPVPERAAVGDRTGGLQRRRRRLVVLHARPGPFARLPLGRGRHRGRQRRQAAAVFRAGPVERPRPDPQGADVRAHEHRGQPRRGRQGVLLLPRQHPDAFVHEVPLQVPAGRVPLRRPRRDEPGPWPPRLRVRAAGHRDLRRGPLLRRRRGVREGRAGGPARRDHGAQPRTRRGHPPSAADPVVPAHLVLGRAVRRSPGCVPRTAPSAPTTRNSAPAGSTTRARARPCSPTTRPTTHASSAARTPPRT